VCKQLCTHASRFISARKFIEAATFNSLPMAKNLCTSSSLAPDVSSHEPVELAESTPHQLFIESIVKFPKNY
jgi:hypothetical protein